MWDNIIILLKIITFYGSDYYIVEAIVISIICKVKCKKWQLTEYVMQISS